MRAASAANAPSVADVMADAVAVAVPKAGASLAPKGVVMAAAKAAVRAGASLVLTDAVRVAAKAGVANAASAVRKAALNQLARSAQPVTSAMTARQKVAATTVRDVKAVGVNATAGNAAIVVTGRRAMPPSRTLRWPIRRQWQRPWVASLETLPDGARTDRRRKQARATKANVKCLVRAAGNAAASAVAVVTSVVANARTRKTRAWAHLLKI